MHCTIIHFRCFTKQYYLRDCVDYQSGRSVQTIITKLCVFRWELESEMQVCLQCDMRAIAK